MTDADIVTLVFSIPAILILGLIVTGFVMDWQYGREWKRKKQEREDVKEGITDDISS